MDNGKITIANGGLTFEGMGFITFIVFLILKLTNVIDWSWFWVWFPLWIPLAVDALIIVILIIVFLIIDKKDF